MLGFHRSNIAHSILYVKCVYNSYFHFYNVFRRFVLKGREKIRANYFDSKLTLYGEFPIKFCALYLKAFRIYGPFTGDGFSKLLFNFFPPINRKPHRNVQSLDVTYE